MKDFIQFIVVCVLTLGLIAAVPVLGFTVGIGLGLWFLWNAWKEERDARS
jgi:hypothetical protein